MIDGIALRVGKGSFFFGEINVFEERNRRRLNGWVREFVSTNGGDNLANLRGREIGDMMFGDIALDGVIKRTRHLALTEAQSNTCDKKLVFLGGI